MVGDGGGRRKTACGGGGGGLQTPVRRGEWQAEEGDGGGQAAAEDSRGLRAAEGGEGRRMAGGGGGQLCGRWQRVAEVNGQVAVEEESVQLVELVVQALHDA
ncbi:hypothetical protein PF007_g14605 [Phytophthora fragariae]|uniref:Uncharacterized protein n=1 Tax=Phytophthora fragariae TaxID=53985 RepID=A0A6A3RTP1_9STRA|nr:hypothetical protein PF007_g14605 [Phytophthora fragariae]